MITMGTACSGLGGAEVAALIAGLPIRSQWAIEIGKHQAAILEARLRLTVYGDVYACGRDNLAPVDLFCAGFPCQPFSVAGLRGGAKDPRNLWPEIKRITKEIGARAVLFENVPALRNPHPAGAVLEDDEDADVETPGTLPGYLGTVLGDLVDLGYHVAWDGRSASSMGAHHRRDRVWIVGWKAGAVADFDPFWPEDRAVDARLVGVWTGERWERPGLFGGEPVMKWPRAGVVRGREAYEVGTSSEASVRSIAWPQWQTPNGIEGGGNKSRGGARSGELLLSGQASAALYPTPLAGSNQTDSRANSAQGGINLIQTVRAAIYPTPRAEDSEQTGAHHGTPDTLTSAVRALSDPLWATAAARDWKDSGEGTDYAAIAAKSRLSGEAHVALLGDWYMPRSGLLNPRWVEALMGYPPGWTDITITNPEDLIAPWEVADAWGLDCYRVGDIEGTNPEYAGYWLWHESLGPLALPTAPRDAQTKNRLVSLGNAWVPQVAAPIMARIVEALGG